MKKLTLTLLALLLATNANAALAKCTLAEPVNPVAIAGESGYAGKTVAVTNGDSSGDNNVTQTASSGGVNQAVTVQGNGNAVNVNQMVNAGGVTYDQRIVHETIVNEITVIQVTPAPSEAPAPDYSIPREQTATYGTSFMRDLVKHLRNDGWTVIWEIQVSYTNSFVSDIIAYKGDVTIEGYKILYSRRSTESPYRVALVTEYHPGWMVADYPRTEVVFRDAEEADAIEMVVSWFRIRYAELISTVTVTMASASICGCCKNCSCGGACHPGCGCECVADLGTLTEPATEPALPTTGAK